jgi:hypothetical protein
MVGVLSHECQVSVNEVDIMILWKLIPNIFGFLTYPSDVPHTHCPNNSETDNLYKIEFVDFSI